MSDLEEGDLTVAGLIEMLSRCPPDAPVYLAYDSMVCRYAVREGRSFILDAPEDPVHDLPGVYLCAMDEDSVDYHRDEVGGRKIPENGK
jgi:hypothetical protein